MTEKQIELTLVPSRDICIEAALLSRRARQLKFHIILLVLFLCSAVDDVIHKGFNLSGEVIGLGIITGLYISIMTFFRWRFVKLVRKMFEEKITSGIKYAFTADALILSSDVGVERLSWDKVKKIIASARVVVLTYDGLLVPLPVSEISEEIKIFLRKKIQEYRINVSSRQARRLFG